MAGREDRGVRNVASQCTGPGFNPWMGNYRGTRGVLWPKGKKACEEDRKVASQEETTKGGGEGLTGTSAESVLSQQRPGYKTFF